MHQRGNHLAQIVEPLHMRKLRLQLRDALAAHVPLGQVAQDFRSAHDMAALVADRRNRHRYADNLAILAPPRGFVMLHALAGGNAREQRFFFGHAAGWKDGGDRLPHHFSRGIAEQLLRRLVPGKYGTAQILGDDRVIG
jgi:hypothetical protein